MSFLDGEKACLRISNLWRRLGAAYEKAAYQAMEKGLHSVAMDCARKAEVCFWQATGECTPLGMRDLGYNRESEA